jgi:hypothetical protein
MERVHPEHHRRVADLPPGSRVAVPVDRAPVRGMFKILAGRAPHGSGEAAVHPEALEAFAAAIGDEIVLEDISLTLRVTSTVVLPEHLRELTAVVGAGTLASVRDAAPDGYYIDVPPGGSIEEALNVLANEPSVEGYQTRDDVISRRNQDLLVATSAAFAGAALALFCTGLLAAAAFVVGAHSPTPDAGADRCGGRRTPPRESDGPVRRGHAGVRWVGTRRHSRPGWFLRHPSASRRVGGEGGGAG